MRDGTYRWMHSRALPRRGPDGEIVEWYGSTEDISERRSSQDALREETRALEILNTALGRRGVGARSRAACPACDGRGRGAHRSPVRRVLLQRAERGR